MEKTKLVMQKVMQFLNDAKVELKRVTWPSRKQTMASTFVVIIIVFVMAVYFGIIDFGLAKLIKLILG
jgi:preprotein translocase subunit SecE